VSEITNNEDMTVWDGAYEYSDDGTNTVESEAVYLSIPKETIPANGIFSIFAEKDFTLKAMATAPVTSVSGNCVGSTAQVTVENPVDSVIYSLNTYYGTKDEKGNIGQEFMVDSRMVNSSSNESYTSSILLESTGSAAPTGEYYVTTILSDPEGLPIASCQLGTINYTNNTVPVQPASVSLEKIGNETLRATWSKVESSNPKVDGYKLTVYQKDGETLVDTGRGYDLTVADLENNDISVSENTIPGLSYDPDNKTYSIDMALTVGGVDMNDEGQEVHDENLAGLPADKEYAIGVSAYTNKEVFAFASGEDLSAEGDGDTSSDKISVPSGGKERISGTSSIAQYKETSFNIYVDGNQLSQDPDTKTYTYTGNVNGASRLVLDGFNAGGADVSGAVAVTVSYKDENGEEKTLDEEGGYYNLPVFTGSLPLDIKVVYTHDGVGDETTAHVNIDRDDAPPVITLDQTVFYADENGNYSVTGITEPDSQINAIFEYGSGKSSETKQFTVSANGIFAIEGQLQLSASAESGVSAESVSNNTVMDYQSVMITMKATDACGNDSSEINTIVSKQVKKPAATITKRPVLSTASLTYNGSEQNYVSAEGEADGGTIMYALTKDDLAPESNSDYSSNATVVNAGTYFVWVKAVADIRHADSSPVKLGKITVAKKTEAPNTPKNLNVSNNVLKLTNNILSENYPGWEWAAEDLNKEISESGSIRATAIYTAEDKDNYKNVSVVISVFRAEHTHEADEAVKENNVAPGCLTNGSYDMVTYCIHCHAELSRENKKVPPAGHDYSVSYTWSQDGKSCVGKAVCKRAGCNASTQGHFVTEEATVTTGSKTGATKDEVVTVYTAAFKNGIFKTQTKEISYKKSGTQVTDTKTGSKVVVTSKAGEDPAVAYKGPVKAKAKNVTVPSAVTINGISYKVTSIADNAFKGNKAVKKLKLPDTITTIGKNAFMGTNLKTVTIPASVKKIGANAFKNTKLKTVTIKSKKITSIGKNAFGKKGGKYKVILPKSLKKKERKKYETMLKRAGVPKKNIKYK
ncbi:MAG: leucine-rich repeat domain-containing protein, partial [Lachnospiraceae bacterium]|nr:leucine-rich repeat domain-containing protein [Lachnospiraceae bacterium]